MKKSFIALFLAFSVLAMPFSAFAADVTSGNMTVNYEYTAPEPPPDTTTYILNIPSAVTNDSLDMVELTASKNTIPAGKELVITYDYDMSTPGGGYFKIYKDKGEATEEFITCRIFTYSDSAKTTGFYLDGMDKDTVAAEFPAGSTTPSYGGFLEFKPLTQGSGVSSGTYTGTVYFNIEVRDAV